MRRRNSDPRRLRDPERYAYARWERPLSEGERLCLSCPLPDCYPQSARCPLNKRAYLATDRPAGAPAAGASA